MRRTTVAIKVKPPLAPQMTNRIGTKVLTITTRIPLGLTVSIMQVMAFPTVAPEAESSAEQDAGVLGGAP